jgi:small conductance mechanosensitive channel
LGGVTPASGPLLANLQDACGDTPGWLCEKVYDWTGNTAVTTAVDWFVARPLNVLIIVLVAFIAIRISRRLITRWVASLVKANTSTDGSATGGMLGMAAGTTSIRTSTRAKTIGNVSRGLVAAFVWTIAFFLVLGTFDVNLAPLIAGAGIAGVALGFGAQTMVRDFLSGFFMLVEDQFGVGDVIDVGEASGTVEGFTLRATTVRDVNGIVWHVPNGEILRVGNKSQQWARALLDVVVAYGSDLREAEEAIKAAADEVVARPKWKDIVLEPPEVWGVERLDPNGVAIRLVIKTQPGEQWDLMRELRLKIKESLDEAGVKAPAPSAPAAPPPGTPGAAQNL